MDANESLFVACYNGVFLIPEALYRSLSSFSRDGFLYLREDLDVLTISSRPVAEGRRRVLNVRFRSPMFRAAKQLAIVDLKESIRVMAVT